MRYDNNIARKSGDGRPEIRHPELVSGSFRINWESSTLPRPRNFGAFAWLSIMAQTAGGIEKMANGSKTLPGGNKKTAGGRKNFAEGVKKMAKGRVMIAYGD